MRTFLKTTSLVIAMVLGTIAAQAGDTPQISDEQIAQFEQTIARLNLTDEQRNAAAPVIEAGIKERLKIVQDAGFERGKRPSLAQVRKIRGPLKDSRSRTEDQLDDILNDTQMKEYRKIMEERRAAMRERLRSKQ